MENPAIDWTTFTRKIYINRPITDIFNAWASADAIEKWFIKSCTYTNKNGHIKDKTEKIEVGDTYKWVWHGWPDHTQDGKVTSIIENEEIGLTFGDAGDVIVQFIDKDGGTEMLLSQSNIPTTEFAKYNYYYGCTMGWSFWMVNLKAYLEHGIVLDERSGNYSGEMGVVNQ